MDVLYCLAPQKMVTEKNIRYKARRYNMSKKASETPEVPSYIPPASEKEKIIENKIIGEIVHVKEKNIKKEKCIKGVME